MKKQAAKRLQWAKYHQHWTRDNFAKVLWSDKTCVQQNNNSPRKRVFRRKSNIEKYA